MTHLNVKKRKGSEVSTFRQSIGTYEYQEEL